MIVHHVDYYRVEVHIDPRAYELYRDTAGYQRDIAEAVEGCNHSGCNAYSVVEEWAEYDYKDQATACGERLEAVAAKYKAMAEEHDREDQDQ